MHKFASIIIASMLLSLVGLTPTQPAQAAEAGDLIKCQDFSSVYYLADDNTRLVFPNEHAYFTWYTDFDDVVEISCEELSGYPLGEVVTYRPGTRLVKIQSINKVYAVEPGGVLRWIVTQAQAENLYGLTWNTRIDDVDVSFWGTYTEGNALPWGEYPTGTILQSEDSGLYYRVNSDDSVGRVDASYLDAIRQSYAIEVTHAYLVSLNAGQAGTITEEEYEELEEMEAEPEIEELTEEEEEQIEEAEAEEDVPEGDLPDSPTLTFTQVDGYNSASITLNWELVDLESTYVLEEDNDPNFGNPTTLLDEELQTSYAISDTVEETTDYYFRIKAVNDVGESEWSEVSTTIYFTEDPYHLISGVPDADQPPYNYFQASNTDNWSAGMAAANIIYYLDDIDYTYTDGLSGNLTPSQMAAALGYFMDLNNIGSDHRYNNGYVYGGFHLDIGPGIEEYAIWEVDNPSDYGFPVPGSMANKTSYYGFDTIFYNDYNSTDEEGWVYTTEQLDSGMPVLMTFDYWNPIYTNESINDIHFYTWGDEIETAADAEIAGAPDESCDSDYLGKAVTVVGYLDDYDLNDGNGVQDWLIVHDNWSNTEENVAIPFDYWNYMFIVQPGADELPNDSAHISGPDTANSGETFTLSWDPVNNATYYIIQHAPSADFSSPQEIETTIGSLDYTYENSHSVIKAAHTYYYRIKPINMSGHGEWGAVHDILVSP